MSNPNRTIIGRYAGERGPLFKIAMITSLLTLVTLGIYRFWAKTRIRQYIWSSTSSDNDAFEYTGTGLEKLLGFLVAIVFLAVYLGIIQMVLLYFGMNIFTQPRTEAEMLMQFAATYITLFAVMPLMYFAYYRSRRYKLARTRWRGIRFGAEKGAWGYVWRRIGHTILTMLTLGILLPRQTFNVEKYVTDRSWYGTAKFEQNGRWQELYPAMKHLIIGLLILVGAVIAAAVLRSPVLAFIMGGLGYFWVIIGAVSYQVQAFIYLTRNKVLNGNVTFKASPETGTIVVIVLVGGLVIGLLAAAVGFILFSLLTPMLLGGGQPTTGSLVIFGAIYVLFLLIISALSLVWVVQPIIEHIVSSFAVHNADGLDDIGQRESDTGADADGFADALDIGGAI